MERRCNCFPFMYEPRPGATGRVLFNHIIVQMYEKNSRMLSPFVGVRKILLTMRFSSSFSFCTAMHLSASVHSQNVVFSFNLKNATFEDLMKEIRQHSDYYFIYKDSEVAQVTKLNKRFKSVSIDEVLKECLKGTGLTYSVEDQLIIIKKNQVTTYTRYHGEKRGPVD